MRFATLLRTSLLVGVALASSGCLGIGLNKAPDGKGMTFSANSSMGASVNSKGALIQQQSDNSVKSISHEKIKPPLLSQDLAASGFTTSEKAAMEKKYGPYVGTFGGVALFGVIIGQENGNRRLQASVVSKKPIKKIEITFQALSKEGSYELESEKEQSQPFTQYKASCPLPSANIHMKDIRLVEVAVN